MAAKLKTLSLRRRISITYYTAATVLFSWIFLMRLTDGSRNLLSTSSYGIPYWALYMLVFGVPIFLFVWQIIKYDKWSSRLIILLIVAVIFLSAYEQYDFYYTRNVMPSVSGPVPYPTVWELVKGYWVLFGGVVLSVVLGARNKRNI